MGDIMRPVPFKELITRIFEEYTQDRSIFAISESQFFQKTASTKADIFGESCETVLGPAAGPHTQLAQNIITSYLTGGRFMELKTVQILDTLEVEKPCIDADDEGYNTEWSTEYTVPKAYDEYVKAWFILYMLEELFQLRKGNEKSFIFNMSVGYDLKGIKSPKVDVFINDLIDSKTNEVFQGYVKELEALIEDGSFLKGTGLEGRLSSLKGLPAAISPKMCNQVTLSTMHGCPPDEIEAICMYMLSEKKLHTFVKLNPTLLGFQTVRKILDGLGFTYVALKEESFDHDLQYNDAIGMLQRLMDKAQEEGLKFGVKLTNTLGTVNNKGALPGDEMYMSGRALFPLSINLAAKISQAFHGELPISYSGGASQFNVEGIFETGIRPVTLATDMLHPGGYLRMKEMAAQLENSSAWNMEKIDVAKLQKLAEESLSGKYTRKEWRGSDYARVDKDLPLFDCYIAPCVAACPIHQDIPEYIRFVQQKKYKEALDVIYERNALPSITGHICDHQCMFSCTRLDYEGCVQIREIKKIAVKNGFEEYKKHWTQPEKNKGVKVAVIGAGPAGLSAAYFLTREGFDVTLLERRESAGGVVEHLVPRFRIPQEAVKHDIQFVEAHGVKFQYGVNPEFKLADLKQAGYTYICLGMGAEAVKDFALKGDNKNLIPSLQFLDDYHKDPKSRALGKHVVVVGGGNTAMDSSRAALRADGVESVTVVYRRTEQEMPADRESYEEALEDHIQFMFLTNPEEFYADGTLICRVMKLGELDQSGRRRPVPTEETVKLHADTLITAIGENVDLNTLSASGLKMGTKGWPEINEETLETVEPGVYLIGDAHTGPSTIVECIAEARKAADAICRQEDPNWSRDISFKREFAEEDILQLSRRKGILKDFIDPKSTYDVESFGTVEGARCLECNYICNKCVDVCPNRANIVIPVENGDGFTDPLQILHLDAYCNECGNCGTFCPYNGNPYLDKFTIFNLDEDFENSENPGLFIHGSDVKLRLGSEVHAMSIQENGALSGLEPPHAHFASVKKVIATVYNKYNYLLGTVGK